MRKLLSIGTLFALLVLFALPVLAHHNDDHTGGGGQDVCPESGKVESTVDGDLDDIVLDAGTLVCIKGGQTLVNVTADGESTLAELLGTGQNVSHYTVLGTPTTTTQPEDTTTTTVEDTTTTTEQETTTTTDPEDNDNPVVEEPAGGRVGASEPPEDADDPNTGLTPLPRLIPSTSDTGTPTPDDTLPFTGPADGLLPVGVALLLAGGAALGLSRRLRMEDAE